MRTRLVALVALLALACAIAAAPASAANPTEEFSALANIQAQPLTDAEMEAIQGALTVDDIKAFIVAKYDGFLERFLLALVDRLAADPRFQALLARLTSLGF